MITTNVGIPRCEVCGHAGFRWRGQFRLEEYCLRGHPPRGAKVEAGVPAWLRARLNLAFPGEVGRWIVRGHGAHRTRLISRGEAESFLLNGLPGYSELIDHHGHTGDALIFEPYGSRERLEPIAAQFADLLKVNYSVAQPTWHAPWFTDIWRVEMRVRP